MSLQRGRKLKKYFTAFLICGAFLFIFSVKNVSAAGATSTYEKLDYGTLSATEWNDLLHDFANTWSSVTMQGPVGIATSSPTDGVIKLDVNGVVRATGFLGILNGSVTAGNVTAGTFGSNYGGGNYIFDVASGNVGIGVPSPQVALDVLGSANFTGTVNGSGLCIAGACKDTWGSIVSAGGGNLWSGTTTSAIWNANTGFNVGIGTTNPLHKLNIQGTGSSTAFIAFNNSLNSWPYVGLGYDQIADGLAFNYNSGSTNLNYTGMFMNRSGSVGIGTTALSGAKFKIALSNISATDSYDDQSKIATLAGATLSSSKLQISQAVCGSYSVVGPDGITYGTVLGADTKCWLDRNLGATRVATAFNDTQSYGYLYQWGRGVDGHQILSPISGTTATLSSSDSPGHANFITAPSSPYDWRTPQNNNLWQGVSGVNNPCPTGFRLPLQSEWQTLVTAIGGFTNATCGLSSTCREVAFNSSLKLPVAGYRDYSYAGLNSQGSYGYYWSSTPGGIYAHDLYFYATGVYPADYNTRAYGFSVRCVKD